MLRSSEAGVLGYRNIADYAKQRCGCRIRETHWRRKMTATPRSAPLRVPDLLALVWGGFTESFETSDRNYALGFDGPRRPTRMKISRCPARVLFDQAERLELEHDALGG